MNLKELLGCRFGFHRYGPWEWEDWAKRAYNPLGIPMQNRVCRDCPKSQGPLVSSEERRYYESWRDR